MVWVGFLLGAENERPRCWYPEVATNWVRSRGTPKVESHPRCERNLCENVRPVTCAVPVRSLHSRGYLPHPFRIRSRAPNMTLRVSRDRTVLEVGLFS